MDKPIPEAVLPGVQRYFPSMPSHPGWEMSPHPAGEWVLLTDVEEALKKGPATVEKWVGYGLDANCPPNWIVRINGDSFSATDEKRAHKLAAILNFAAQQQGQAVACTCPSGDGSLRWPCPAHPAGAQAQGGGEVAALKRMAGKDEERMRALESRAERRAEELRYVLLQNECGMVLTGDEIRKARAELDAATLHPTAVQENGRA